VTTKETAQPGLRVLIVEDEEALREVFRQFVAGLGHEPIAVATAEDALEQFLGAEPHAVLLDVRLPGMSGLDFLELPAVRESGVPIVAISGVATEAQARECLKRGALDFISKPVTLDRLSAVLAYVEPFARARAQSEQARGADRRPAPRVGVDLPVRLVTQKGVPWESTCTELSATGMRVVTRARLRPGHAVKVAFTPPGGGAPLDAVALVVRVDKGGAALWFLDLLPHEVERLRTIVDRLRL
jgi:CheY-like chemotaxis protein